MWGTMVARYDAAPPQSVASHATEQWTPPLGVIIGDVDRATGLLATDQTPPDQRYPEYFLEGTEPPSLTADPWNLSPRGPSAFSGAERGGRVALWGCRWGCVRGHGRGIGTDNDGSAP